MVTTNESCHDDDHHDHTKVFDHKLIKTNTNYHSDFTNRRLVPLKFAGAVRNCNVDTEIC